MSVMHDNVLGINYITLMVYNIHIIAFVMRQSRPIL